jgi:hypothetical protein
MRQPISPPIAIRNAAILTSHPGRTLQTAIKITAPTIIGITPKTVTRITAKKVPNKARTSQSGSAKETSEGDLIASSACKEMVAMTGVRSAGRRKYPQTIPSVVCTSRAR